MTTCDLLLGIMVIQTNWGAQNSLVQYLPVDLALHRQQGDRMGSMGLSVGHTTIQSRTLILVQYYVQLFSPTWEPREAIGHHP